jgi:Bromodomain
LFVETWLRHFRNFQEKPSKKIPGYYAVIKQPTSISDVKRMVEKGKLKDWNTFAAEVRLIWDNCKTFNEDDSDIYAIAEELEV